MVLFRKKNLDEWAWDYWLLQRYAKLIFNVYYRKVEVLNLHRIPLKQPVIIAPNHQNALMDAMIMVCKTPWQPVFLARADIFKGKRLIRFLTYLNIMPIYRIRDGIENVRKNDEVFDRTVQVLHNCNNPLILFPEGNHGDKRRLRPLVKGLFRIAFQAQEKFGDQPAVKIVPVGYDYGHYTNFRTTILVNVGEPIEVSQFMGTFRENPVLAINELKDHFAAAISHQMIDIQTEEYYDLYMQLRVVFNADMRSLLGVRGSSLADKFRADKAMIDALNHELEANPEIIRNLDELMKKYQQALTRNRLRDRIVGTKGFNLPECLLSSLLKLIFFPFFVAGFIHNYLPYRFTASRTRNIKDQQFHSSFKYVVGMIVFPVWYLLIAALLILTPLPGWWIPLYLMLLLPAGLFAFHYFIRIKIFLARCRFFLKRNTQEIRDLVDLRKLIINKTREIVTRQNPDHENQG